MRESNLLLRTQRGTNPQSFPNRPGVVMEVSLHRVRRALDPVNRPSQPMAAAPAPDTYDVSFLVGALIRNAWIIALCTFVALCSGYIYAFHIADVTYKSSASVVLRQDSREPLDGTSTLSRAPLSSEEISTERAFVVSVTNLSAVARQLDLVEDPDFNYYLGSQDGLPDPEVRDEFFLTATVSSLRDAIVAETVVGTTIIRVTAEAFSPTKARDIANAVIDQYRANHVASEQAIRRREIDRLSARLDELQGQLIAVEAKIDAFQFTSSDDDQRLRDTVELEKLGSEANAIRGLYQAVLERYSKVSVEAAPQRTEIAVLDRAVLPLDNASPRTTLILAFSLLIGGAIGTYIALARDVFSDRIRSPRDLGRLTGRPVVAMSPKLGRAKRIGTVRRQFGLDRPASITAMENVRTSISLLAEAQSRAAKVISVVSATPEEGKSSLALALAASYAEAGVGTQVLVIDTDLRRRTLSKWLTPARNSGLVSVLSGYTELDEAVEVNQELDIDVLSCEVTPRNPLDLLASEQFARMIQTARLTYDVVILDTAPMLAVPDGKAVCTMADIVVYAASQKQSLMTHLSETFAEVGSAGKTVDAVILSEARHGFFDGNRKQLRQSYLSSVGTTDVRSTASGT